jgi:acetylornithine deacetylase/succinyl-diaminopimelate desuccinylase-like protein
LTPQAGRVLFSRAREAVTQGAAASIGVAGSFGAPRRNQTAAAGQEVPDFETVERIDKPVEPQISASDEFFDFLFSGADVKYAELKAKADAREPLPAFALKNVRITFNIDPNYRVVRTRYTRNVVGIVEGADARLKETYVAFGAHYDHVGYSEGEVQQAESGARLLNPRGRVTKGQEADRIWNGADDDGSGTVGILAIAKAFATGPKPKRSLIFVWHTGEERGLWGSRYFADSPTVPLDKIVAQINIDMIGRNNAGDAKYANQVFVVGSDRISTELHNLSVDANGALMTPLELDYGMNDP